jgi:hypothetical protein
MLTSGFNLSVYKGLLPLQLLNRFFHGKASDYESGDSGLHREEELR